MSGCRFNISLIIVLVSLSSIQAFSQQINNGDSLAEYNSRKVNLKPVLNYTVGSSFISVPHLDSVTGFTLSPFLSIPLSPKWSVDGGIIAGRYYSTWRNMNTEGIINGAFSDLSVYGSASYHVNSQLTLYGTGIKQLTATSPFNWLPKSSYSIGSTYNFGSFSIGVTLQTSKWNDNHGPMPFNDNDGFYLPYK
jgi:hypothetical protein